MFPTGEVAKLLGVTSARVRQLAIESHATDGDRVGTKMVGDVGGWVFTEDEVELLRQRRTRASSPRAKPLEM
jgi:hypothetical protein